MRNQFGETVNPNANPALPPATGSGNSLVVIALRRLARRERVQHCGHGSYTKVFNYLQYQTSDGVWHRIPEVYEDTTESPNDELKNAGH